MPNRTPEAIVSAIEAAHDLSEPLHSLVLYWQTPSSPQIKEELFISACDRRCPRAFRDLFQKLSLVDQSLVLKATLIDSNQKTLFEFIVSQEDITYLNIIYDLAQPYLQLYLGKLFLGEFSYKRFEDPVAMACFYGHLNTVKFFIEKYFSESKPISKKDIDDAKANLIITRDFSVTILLSPSDFQRNTKKKYHWLSFALASENVETMDFIFGLLTQEERENLVKDIETLDTLYRPTIEYKKSYGMKWIHENLLGGYRDKAQLLSMLVSRAIKSEALDACLEGLVRLSGEIDIPSLDAKSLLTYMANTANILIHASSPLSREFMDSLTSALKKTQAPSFDKKALVDAIMSHFDTAYLFPWIQKESLYKRDPFTLLKTYLFLSIINKRNIPFYSKNDAIEEYTFKAHIVAGFSGGIDFLVNHLQENKKRFFAQTRSENALLILFSLDNYGSNSNDKEAIKQNSYIRNFAAIHFLLAVKLITPEEAANCLRLSDLSLPKEIFDVNASLTYEHYCKAVDVMPSLREILQPRMFAQNPEASLNTERFNLTLGSGTHLFHQWWMLPNRFLTLHTERLGESYVAPVAFDKKPFSSETLKHLTGKSPFVKKFGRTLLYEASKDSYLAIKLLKKDEDPDVLKREAAIAKHFAGDTAVACHSHQLFTLTDLRKSCPPAIRDQLFTEIEIENSSVKALVYEAPKAYFTRLHEIESLEELNRAIIMNTVFLMENLRKGIFFHSITDMMHARLGGESRDDMSRHEALHALIHFTKCNDSTGEGRLRNWLDGIQNTDLRATGLADLGDVTFLGDDFSKHPDPFMRQYLANRITSHKMLFANSVAEYIQAIMLNIGRHAREQCAGKSRIEINKIWHEHFDILTRVYEVTLSILTGCTLSQAKREIALHMDLEVSRKQFQYWLNNEYVDDVKSRKLSKDAFPYGTVTVESSEQGSWSDRTGYAEAGEDKPDLGPMNGPFPLVAATHANYFLAYRALEAQSDALAYYERRGSWIPKADTQEELFSLMYNFNCLLRHTKTSDYYKPLLNFYLIATLARLHTGHVTSSKPLSSAASSAMTLFCPVERPLSSILPASKFTR